MCCCSGQRGTAASIGYRIADVRTAVLSHLHVDHEHPTSQDVHIGGTNGDRYA
jgi:hypothetical protein